jgi:altronate dehydratase large subunit
MWDAPINGFIREDGRVGIRNLVVVMAAADNVNPLARKLADAVPGVTCLPASYGRGQLGADLDITLRTMAGLASHPNVAGCLIVCFERASGDRLADSIRARGRQAEVLSLLDVGGLTPALSEGSAMLARLIERARRAKRSAVPISMLLAGLECGGSDTSSGLFGNPALGLATDQLLAVGGSAVFSEPVECLGGEDRLSKRARTPQAAQAIVHSIARYRDVALSQGIDLTGVNPTADNIAGGLSTIEEKSLGAIAKTGSAPIEGVIGYGEAPPSPGLWLIDAPAAAVENLTAIAASGAQVIFFVTGSANPVGHPIAPTIKICANPQTMQRMAEHVDVDISGGLAGDPDFSLDAGAKAIAAAFRAVAEGAETAAERLGYLETNISRFGLSV